MPNAQWQWEKGYSLLWWLICNGLSTPPPTNKTRNQKTPPRPTCFWASNPPNSLRRSEPSPRSEVPAARDMRPGGRIPDLRPKRARGSGDGVGGGEGGGGALTRAKLPVQMVCKWGPKRGPVSVLIDQRRGPKMKLVNGVQQTGAPPSNP